MVEAGPGENNEVPPKTEPAQDAQGSLSSSVSTPELEAEVAPDPAQTQKRKGGRKPIYATSEERKQRNRQAQAAFRERRTEYIKQLETTIKRNEETLQSLQQSHRNAADECLMLRYKNSLLERILLEKGIDVQAELRLKTGNPAGLPPIRPGSKQSSPLERAAISRNSAQRHSTGGLAPKSDVTPGGVAQPRDGAYNIHSPQLQPSPSSLSSPSTGRSPGFALQGAMSPKGAEFPTQQQQQQQQSGRAVPMLSQQRGYPQSASMGDDSLNATAAPGASSSSSPPQSMMPGSSAPSGSMAAGMSSLYYPSPFQKQYNQLDFSRPPGPTDSHGPPPLPGTDVDSGIYSTNGSVYGHYEPIMDSDTFGLSASMHFHTPFSYEQAHLRR
ncbi:hypothetical protein VTN31DRAFT_5528 [Thermomyces dupontii]|uniref:uncharacterized protein n=1 Tax=Talaromyces thermophilus TaxID=28565 RepID=UPI003743BB0D